MLNERLFHFLFNLTQGPFVEGLVVFFAEYLVYILILVAVVFVFILKGWRLRLSFFAQMMLATILSRGIITEAIRFFYPSPRPGAVLDIMPLFEKVSSGFPSGHTAFLFAIGTTTFFFSRKWGSLYLATAFLIGVSRIMAGVHWPVDIVVGILVGAGSSLVVYLFARGSMPNSQPALIEKTDQINN